MTKNDIRKIYIAARKNIPKADREKYQKRILEKILAFDKIKKAETVFAYLSLPQEVETREIIAALLREGKKVAIPKVLKKTKAMEFHYIKNIEADTKKGEYGIYEPHSSLKKALDYTGAILIPGVAFDRIGHRIGFGAGYYDKFLDDKESLLKIGLCFSCQLSKTHIPASSHDVKTDFIITENEIIEIQKEIR